MSHIPAIVAKSAAVEPVDLDAQLALRLVLPLQNEAGLDAFLTELADPRSSQYRQFLTPDSFAEQFHPASATIEQVRSSLAQHGFQIDDVHGAVVSATAAVRDVQELFGTSLMRYQQPDGTAFFAPAAEVQIPQGLPVRAVVGLSSARRYRSNAHVRQLNAATPQATAAPAIFTPQEFRVAYNMPSALDGNGQIIGLVELDGYLPNDITGFANAFALPAPNVKNYFLDGATGAAGSSSFEPTIDIEMALALAPGAQVRVYEAPDSSAVGGVIGGMEDIFNELANPTLGDRVPPPVVSCSWYYLETEISQAEVTQEQTFLKQMVAQGQTLFVASGDAGATPDGAGELSVEGPASEPYAVAVGGTLLTTGTGGAYQSETTWDDPTNKQGGGGGISSLFTLPSYQVGVANGSNKASSAMRNVPDVALESGELGGGFACYAGGELVSGWGTSFSAPLWGAFTAVVAQQRAQRGLLPLGFLNPVLYQLGQGAQSAAVFHDVADGSSNGFYPAVSGYDDATGWGSFNGTALLGSLGQGYARRVFTPPSGFFGP